MLLNYKDESEFIYEVYEQKGEVIALIKNDKFVKKCNTECYIFIYENPFYAESGGQVCDKGTLKNNSCKLEVLDVIKCPNKQHLIKVKVLEGTIIEGESIIATVDKTSRENTTRNHSAVHLLQKTLQSVLGNSVHHPRTH